MIGYELVSPFHDIPKELQTKISEILSRYESIDEMEKIFNFRDFTMEYLTFFKNLSQDIKWHLENEFRFVVVRQLPFANYGEEICRFLLLSLTSLIGTATYTGLLEKSKVWSVKLSQDLKAGYCPTISEHNGRADLHTDSSYKTLPERYVAMFVVKEAKDGGGSSFVADGKDILSKCETDLLNILEKNSCPI
jgi:hypothetical protein